MMVMFVAFSIKFPKDISSMDSLNVGTTRTSTFLIEVTRYCVPLSLIVIAGKTAKEYPAPK